MSFMDKGLIGSMIEKAWDPVSITLNKNIIIGDKPAQTTSSLRIGAPVVMISGFLHVDMKDVR